MPISPDVRIVANIRLLLKVRPRFFWDIDFAISIQLELLNVMSAAASDKEIPLNSENNRLEEMFSITKMVNKAKTPYSMAIAGSSGSPISYHFGRYFNAGSAMLQKRFAMIVRVINRELAFRETPLSQVIRYTRRVGTKNQESLVDWKVQLFFRSERHLEVVSLSVFNSALYIAPFLLARL